MWLVFFVVFNVCTLIFGQLGRECGLSNDCHENQSCLLGYCVCVPKFVKIERYCFPVKRWNEDCFFEEQCQDHRLVCENRTEETNNIKKCICDTIYEWDEKSLQCVLRENFTNVWQTVEKERTRIVYYPPHIDIGYSSILVAAFVITAYLLVILVNVLYCKYMEYSDKRYAEKMSKCTCRTIELMKNNLAKLKKKSTAVPAPSEQIQPNSSKTLC